MNIVNINHGSMMQKNKLTFQTLAYNIFDELKFN